MAPAPNNYRARVPLFDARQRRLAPQERWPRWIGWSISVAAALALWALIIRVAIVIVERV
jgi:hypothetical protein